MKPSKPLSARARLRRIRLVMPWVSAVLVLTLWEAFCRATNIEAFLLPRPSLVFATLMEYRTLLVSHTLQTLFTTLAGFALAITGGMLLGLLIGASAYAYAGLYPVLIALNSIPKVALVPVLVIWFGIGTVPAILSSFLISFFPVVVNVATGLATIEPETRDVLRSLKASRWDVLVKVGIPRSLPYLFASLRVAITLAFVGSILAETIASNNGIGYVMLSASSRMETSLVFAAVFVVSVMGVTMSVLCAKVERRMTGWAYRGQGTG